MNRDRLLQFLPKFEKIKILVFGDYMLDQFLWGKVDRISPEAPVPVVDVEKETFSAGGAGNVVMNVRDLGASVVAVGIVGDDAAGKKLLSLMTREKIESKFLVHPSRPTTTKTRIIAHQQQVVRIDRENRSSLDEETEAQLVKSFESLIGMCDAIIVSDYSKGTLSPKVLSKILPAAKKAGKPVCLDPKIRYFSSYSPVTAITPNQAEASSLLGYPIQTNEDLEEAGKRILDLIDCKALLITRGDKGMALFAEGKLTLVPTRAREVYDVTGAGDTVISALCLALAAGAELIEAVELANLAAGIVVAKLGTATVSPDELLQNS